MTKDSDQWELVMSNKWDGNRVQFEEGKDFGTWPGDGTHTTCLLDTPDLISDCPQNKWLKSEPSCTYATAMPNLHEGDF
jgi:hypothetical protein